MGRRRRHWIPVTAGPPDVRLWRPVVERAQEGAWMIAQVVMATAPTPITDEARKAAADMGSQARQSDGCEGILTLVDPTTGEAVQINLFRDRAALDAFEA